MAKTKQTSSASNQTLDNKSSHQSFILHLPENVTGLFASEILTITLPVNDQLINALGAEFASDLPKGPIRQSYQKPATDSAMIAIESWEVNEELSKLRWETLSIENSGYLIAHYGIFLDLSEKIAVQPIIWKILLFSDSWCEAFSFVLASFREESKSNKEGIKRSCSPAQRAVLSECLNRLLEVLEGRNDWNLDEDIKILRRTIEWWNYQG